MGYYVSIESAEFVIPADKITEADKALRRLNKTHDDRKTGGRWSPDHEEAVEKWFAWMPPDYHKKSVCPNLKAILEALLFEAEEQEDGSLALVNYDNKTGNEDVFLEALAPFVSDGSYIEWRGEDGEHWRNVVRNGTLITQEGRIVYE